MTPLTRAQHSGPCTNGVPCHNCERARLARLGVFFTNEEVVAAIAQDVAARKQRDEWAR